MDSFWDSVLTVARQLTREVAPFLLETFGRSQADEKADGSLVTASDRWADEKLRLGLQTHFPEHGVLSEEGIHTFPEQEWCWVIDPIDGTTNFTRGIPLWGISLGLLYRGTPVFGYVYLPPLEQEFYGYWSGTSGLEMPTGAYRDGQPISTSKAAPGKNQVFSLCARSTAVMKQPFPCKIRMLGVATYNLLTVASGYALGAVEATPKVWDIAAVWAIVQSAGGAWTPLDRQSPFPLRPGNDYSQVPYPTLVTSQAEWINIFLPLVQPVIVGRC